MISNVYLVAFSTVGLFCLLAANQANGSPLSKECNPKFFQRVAFAWKEIDHSNWQALEEVKLLAEKYVPDCQPALYSPSNPKDRRDVRSDIREKVLAAKSCSKEQLEPMLEIPADKLINGAIDYLESSGKIKLDDYKGASIGSKYNSFRSVLQSSFVDEFPRNSGDLEAYQLANEMAVVIKLLQLEPHQSVINDIIDQQIGNALREYTGEGGQTDSFANAVYRKLVQRANGNSLDC